MTYTPEQLRDLADIADGQGIMADGDIYRAHATALEELERVKADYEHFYQLSGRYLERANSAEAALAECRKKCERLKLHAEAMDAATISHVDGRDLLAELHLNRAHYCDIRVRINGEYRTHEGDWLKNLQRERNAYRAEFKE